MFKLSPILILCLSFVSCNFIKQDSESEPIARVNDSFLFKEDIEGLITPTTTKEDSIIIVSNYINKWATQQLLIDQSIINLPIDQQEKFDKLVEDYKVDLYTEAYKSSIISGQLQTTISTEELQQYYERNKGNFKLNDELLRVRYVSLPLEFNNVKDIKNKLDRSSEEDQQELLTTSIKFNSFNLNDSIWIKNDLLLDALPALREKPELVLKKTNITQLQDSLGVYLIKIEEVLKTNDIAPLSYVKPTIEQIIINKRKQELLKKLEKEITIDAIKNKNFETFNKN